MKVIFALILLVLVVAIAADEDLSIGEIGARITNGEVAKRGQFPYQVGLSVKIGKRWAWCGGSLIAKNWVITAGHCAKRSKEAIVYLGAHNIKDDNEEGQIRINVTRKGIYPHEYYTSFAIFNDIALIKLPVDVEFNEYIQPISLPKVSEGEEYSNYAGRTVYASGWGKVNDSSTQVSPLLNFIETKVLGWKRCAPFYMGMVRDKTMICGSGKGGRSVCNGDSGGPMMLKEDGKNVLIGLTSFGISLGCEAGWPGVFTRISHYMPWILKKTGPLDY